MTTLTIHLHFLEPFRMAPWFSVEKRKKNNPDWQRVQTYARWHKNTAGDGRGRPFITGYLLRSALIQAVEEELVFSRGVWSGISCCPGLFFTEPDKDKEKPLNERRRATLGWTENKAICQEEEGREKACPLCLLINRFKENGEDNVHFGNLSLPGSENERPVWDQPEQIAKLRTLNRVDRATTKAHDHFKVYEVEDLTDFYGTITFADDLPQREVIESLIRRGLGFISDLCGALCEIRVEKQKPLPTEPKGITQSKASYVSGLAEMCWEKMAETELRSLAGAVLQLRCSDPKKFTLPKGRIDRNGNRLPHHIWDIELEGNGDKKTLRKHLKETAEKMAEGGTAFRLFCEDVGNRLFRLSKGIPQETPNRQDAFSDPSQVFNLGRPVYGQENHRDPMIPSCEWIITGTLTAASPFFIADELIDDDHISRKLLTTQDFHYRLPRSLLRGILRRDLHEASGGKGCRAELGPESSCICPVCRILNQVKIRDARSDSFVPPDIRQRVKQSHHHRIVQDGALFDTEYGLEGVVFPFELRFKGEKTIDKELRTVMGWWEEGLLFLGGDFGTGKGAFKLGIKQIHRWDLSTPGAREEYEQTCGFRAGVPLDANCQGLSPVSNIDFPKVDYPWQKVPWELAFESPLLTADPIAAITQDEADTIYFQKRRLKSDGSVEYIPALRGEGLRGLIRTATARASGSDHLTVEHEDCTCVLCKTFGNEHRSGLLRFDDLEPKNWKDKRIDHVSIDRFDASVVEKFDDRPLIGSPDKPLVFAGAFWIHRDFTENKALSNGFQDLKSGLYPLGGKVGIGYGRLSKLELPSDWLPNSAENESISVSGLLEGSPETSGIPEKPTWKPEPDAIYNPYYYLSRPGDGPKRTLTPVSHATLSKERYTGRIACFLKVKSPLLLPDSEHDPVAPDKNGTMKAFRLNGTLMIPGSALRSAVSQVYEALTDSCFRVMDQKRVLSWRMETGDHGNYKPGRISESGDQIFPMGEKALRLPLYDMAPGTHSAKYIKELEELHKKALEGNIHRLTIAPWEEMPEKTREKKFEKCNKILGRNLTEEEKKNLTDQGMAKLKISEMELKTLIGRFKKDEESCIEKAQKTDSNIAEIAKHNRDILNVLEKETRQRVLAGKEKVPFLTERLAPNNDINFQIVKLLKNSEKNKKNKEIRWGYLKITGPNNANDAVVETKEEDDKYKLEWEDPLDFSFCLTGPPKNQPNTQKSRDFPRPGFECIKDDKRYTISKRCERLFEADEKSKPIPIPKRVREGYKGILEDYQKNAKKIPKAFQTRLNSDLVYYKSDYVENQINVTALAPVCISRLADDRPLGKRLPVGYQPCSHICLEDCERCTGKACPIPLYREGYPVNGLCPACQLFGAQMYKGRVNFSFATLTPGKNLELRNVTLPAQERPRPTWILPKNVQGKDTEIPGAKFYLRHGMWKKIWTDRKDPRTDKPIEEKNPNNVTIEGINTGAEFRFDVSFENLDENELGWLLYCLELEEDMSHMLGRGKPFGFGQVEIKINELARRLAPNAWYTESPKEGSLIHSKLIVKALAGLKSLDSLRLLLTQYNNLTAYYPELEGKGGKPGYDTLKNSSGYNPHCFLTLQTKGNTPFVYPWFPIPISKPQATKSDIKPKVENHGITGNGFKKLVEGDKVTFEIEERPKGPCAVNVRKVKDIP